VRKRQLAAVHDGRTLESQGRSLAKTEFVRSVLTRAFAAGYPASRSEFERYRPRAIG